MTLRETLQSNRQPDVALADDVAFAVIDSIRPLMGAEPPPARVDGDQSQRMRSARLAYFMLRERSAHLDTCLRVIGSEEFPVDVLIADLKDAEKRLHARAHNENQTLSWLGLAAVDFDTVLIDGNQHVDFDKVVCYGSATQEQAFFGTIAGLMPRLASEDNTSFTSHLAKSLCAATRQKLCNDWNGTELCLDATAFGFALGTRDLYRQAQTLAFENKEPLQLDHFGRAKGWESLALFASYPTIRAAILPK
ncbi:MAG: hypothetical protein HZB70_01975 [Candidatus Berkelbacteria bacterium]|nr:MAG: hypothetical protein HZB70_01975 [Candidatus Berkelbacteria bacterium]QQG51909.1 MAG: hypothetical protein HY845_01020 [Candidatus Berkelbacteria bacterium]